MQGARGLNLLRTIAQNLRLGGVASSGGRVVGFGRSPAAGSGAASSGVPTPMAVLRSSSWRVFSAAAWCRDVADIACGWILLSVKTRFSCRWHVYQGFELAGNSRAGAD